MSGGEGLDRKNMLWEGSRMFLPEHRQALLRQRAEAERVEPPELDEDRLEEINRLVVEALHADFPLVVRWVENGRLTEFCGFIQKVDPHARQLKLADGRTVRTVPFDRLCDAHRP
ncbi:YolD-like family protein [Staphylospora marina]|uniref:YolD-like family protein n=1 Tax=Staphylospora marina TaxID=2490858 RepID=UPI000F5C0924|nr:YolD-like family protein [Staphylospora marina]